MSKEPPSSWRVVQFDEEGPFKWGLILDDPEYKIDCVAKFQSEEDAKLFHEALDSWVATGRSPAQMLAREKEISRTLSAVQKEIRDLRHKYGQDAN